MFPPRSDDSQPQPAPRHVLPVILILIALGVATPFIVSRLHSRKLAYNEHGAIAVLRTVAKAQEAYFQKNGSYALAFMDLNLADVALADAAVKGSGEHYGYRYRILTGQARDVPGGEKSYLDAQGKLMQFGVLAVPAKYGKTGRDIFILYGLNGKIYATDMGPKSDQVTSFINQVTIPENANTVAD